MGNMRRMCVINQERLKNRYNVTEFDLISTPTPAGSWERIEVYRRREELGLPIFSDLDNTNSDRPEREGDR